MSRSSNAKCAGHAHNLVAGRMAGLRLRLLAALVACACAKEAAPAAPKLGSCLDLRSGDENYLKGYQVVGVADPASPERLQIDPETGRFIGKRFSAGNVWWVKKGGSKRTKSGAKPFKVRASSRACPARESTRQAHAHDGLHQPLRAVQQWHETWCV